MSEVLSSNIDTQTEWDSSKATLIRIDKALCLAGEASLNKKYVEWFRYLLFLKREIVVKMNHMRTKDKKCSVKPDDKELCPRCYTDKLFAKVRSNISLYEKGKRAQELITELENDLEMAETFLREFADKKGMLLRDAKGAMEKFQYG